VSVKLLTDVHVPEPIVSGLRLRQVDVLTAHEDGSRRLPDVQLLDRAGVLKRVLFTQDEDFLVETARRQATGESFAGIVYAHQQNISIGKCIDNLELIAVAGDWDDFANRVTYLPL
jgi:predicted nuclease of predicted toxin-antitoxin system